jgi:phosphoribosylformimino-5-aminoimidazole carboxamide ribonucleotide (ProFAR) isomerase
MDHAFEDRPLNLEAVAAVKEAVPGVRVQASGGIRDLAAVRALLEAGADRVVLGSAALGDEDAVAEAIGSAPIGRLYLGIEVAEGRIRSRGRDPVDLDLMTTVGWLRASGGSGFVVTAVARVGTGGPDVPTVTRVARSGVPTLAAGGIASLMDLRAVQAAGAVGAVVGHAAVSGTIDLAGAFDWARQH